MSCASGSRARSSAASSPSAMGLAHVLARHFRHAELPERGTRYLRKMSVMAAARGMLGALRRLDDAEQALSGLARTPARKGRQVRLELARLDLLLDFGRTKEALDLADPRWPKAAAIRGRSPVSSSCAGPARRWRWDGSDEALASLGRIRRPIPAACSARARSGSRPIRMARGEYTKARAVLEAASSNPWPSYCRLGNRRGARLGNRHVHAPPGRLSGGDGAPRVHAQEGAQQRGTPSTSRI